MGKCMERKANPLGLAKIPKVIIPSNCMAQLKEKVQTTNCGEETSHKIGNGTVTHWEGSSKHLKSLLSQVHDSKMGTIFTHSFSAGVCINDG